MEAASWFSVASFVFLLVGAAAGAAAGHFLSPAIGEAKRLRSDLDRLQHEHDSYRASVNSHFRKTADLVGQMTKSYAAVYDHLAGGARRFCDDSGSEPAIPFEPLPGALASPVIDAADEAAVAQPSAAFAATEEASADYAAADYAAAEEAVAEEAAADYASSEESDYAVAGDDDVNYATTDYAAGEDDRAFAADADASEHEHSPSKT